ncbi:MAG: AMP-binding protein [Prosthecobacter sp.]
MHRRCGLGHRPHLHGLWSAGPRSDCPHAKAHRTGRKTTASADQQYAVTVFYTAPTAIRAYMKWGDEWLKKHDLSSLRLLGTVGEPINPEAWMWYHNKAAANARSLTPGGRRKPAVT